MQKTIQAGEQMWLNFADLIHNRVPDRKGHVLPSDLSYGTYDLQDLSSGPGSLLQGNLALDTTWGHHGAPPPGPTCCAVNVVFNPSFMDIPMGILDVPLEADGTDQCSGQKTNVSGEIDTWWSSNPHIAQVTTQKVQSLASGLTEGHGSGLFLEGQGSNCVLKEVQVEAPVTVQVPTSLSIVTGTDSTSSESTCSAGGAGTGCGCARTFTYQVNDQYGNPMNVAGLEVWDAIQTTSPNDLAITGYRTTCSPPNTGPCGATTDANGQFQETPGLSVCSTVCRVNGACVKGGPTNANQTVHVGSAIIVQSLGYYCDHVTVNGK